MTLLRKVVSENCFCKTFKWNPLALYTLHIYMEISLNLLGFTDLFYKEILTNFISFSSMYTFSLNLLLKASVVWAKNYKFSHFFLRRQQYWVRKISQTSELKFITKTFSGSTWFILMDSAIICIQFRNTQLSITLKINAASLIRSTLVIIITNLLKQNLNFSSKAF